VYPRALFRSVKRKSLVLRVRSHSLQPSRICPAHIAGATSAEIGRLRTAIGFVCTQIVATAGNAAPGATEKTLRAGRAHSITEIFAGPGGSIHTAQIGLNNKF
jgi:hypothetical protein